MMNFWIMEVQVFISFIDDERVYKSTLYKCLGWLEKYKRLVTQKEYEIKCRFISFVDDELVYKCKLYKWLGWLEKYKRLVVIINMYVN